MKENEIIRGKSGNLFRFYIALIGIIVGIILAIIGVSVQIDIIIVISGIILWGCILYAIFCSPYEIIVTNKKVCGTASFSKKVELPFDKISAVYTCMNNGIGVSTSSGIIKFLFIKNNLEIYNVISELLEKRQDKKDNDYDNQNECISNADEIKKYKELLDSGAITQEEYEKKKRQLLDL